MHILSSFNLSDIVPPQTHLLDLVSAMIVGSSFPTRMKVKSEFFYRFLIDYFFFVSFLQRKCLLDLSSSLELLSLLLNN